MVVSRGDDRCLAMTGFSLMDVAFSNCFSSSVVGGVGGKTGEMSAFGDDGVVCEGDVNVGVVSTISVGVADGDSRRVYLLLAEEQEAAGMDGESTSLVVVTLSSLDEVEIDSMTRVDGGGVNSCCGWWC